MTRSSTRESGSRSIRRWSRSCNRSSSNRSCELGDAGAQILDVRDAAEYAKGHIAGSINIALGGQYATWAGTVLDRTRPIVIVAEPGREQEAAMRLGRIGFDHVKGTCGTGWSAGGTAGPGVGHGEGGPVILAEELAAEKSAAGNRHSQPRRMENETHQRTASTCRWGIFKSVSREFRGRGGSRCTVREGTGLR